MASTQRPNVRQTAVGVFQNREDAERAVEALHRAGFTDQQIGIAARDVEKREDMKTTGGTDSKAEEGGITGLVAGAGIGGVLGAAAVGLIPGIGPIIAAGALAGILGGAAAGAATGGIMGWLAGQGVPEEEAREYESEVKAGRTLVTVQADGRYDEAAAILQRSGAATRPQTTAPATGDDQLELREERLRARKEPVESGEVSVGKDVVAERQTMEVPVTHEEVEVEYRPVNPREAARGDVVEGDEIRVPVREEQVRAEKETVVTGEVNIRKRKVQGTEEVSDTVRKEKPRITRQGDVNLDAHGEPTEEEPRP
jgi:uncharacterized protein (TIGR02271 family)